jgi:hypothetical protein
VDIPRAAILAKAARGRRPGRGARETFFDQLAAERKLLTVPAAAEEAGKLAHKYRNAALGEISVASDGPKTTFDFGEWKSEVGTKTNPDGTITFVTMVPGMSGFEFTVGSANGKRTLIVRDAQHEYVFDELTAT